ncbi:LysM peptidoglycan-binding domain-containing protein [Lactiplantibacillus nangangensis]|uniref:LysM peptidoglycan-binding domain-containing protein n=1 Tax=Lactiplantibacillus nangangensis TaxID=2559917 RepID=A0ABW1SKY9_9LACO|nr:LysM peptidoglycan-binding domain-containing protein [Lactiplantibacillus nangangensis]
MKKSIRTILTASAVTMGLLFAGAETADAATTYTVKAGDCVWAIAQHYGSSIDAIETTNHIHGHLILPGQQLSIPGTNDQSTSQTTTTSAVTTAPSTNTQSATAPSTTTTTTPAPAAPATTTTNESSYTGGNLQSYVLGQMAARTGVSAGTWNHIITRESNWQPHVRNSSSGAYGLFQNMHISGGSVEEQVDAAVNLYRVQGMQAWAF